MVLGRNHFPGLDTSALNGRDRRQGDRQDDIAEGKRSNELSNTCGAFGVDLRTSKAVCGKLKGYRRNNNLSTGKIR